MKKIIAMILAIVMVLSLAACNNDNQETTEATETTETTETTEATEETQPQVTEPTLPVTHPIDYRFRLMADQEAYAFSGKAMLYVNGWDLTLALADEWKANVEIIGEFTEDSTRITVVNKALAQLYIDNGLGNPYTETVGSDYILQFWSGDLNRVEHSGILNSQIEVDNEDGSTSMIYNIDGETIYYSIPEMNAAGNAKKAELIAIIGQEAYDAAVAEMVVTDEMISEISELLVPYTFGKVITNAELEAYAGSESVVQIAYTLAEGETSLPVDALNAFPNLQSVYVYGANGTELDLSLLTIGEANVFVIN